MGIWADYAIEFILVLVFAASLLRHFRSRTAADIPLMLGSLAGALVLPTIGQFLGVPEGVGAVVGTALFLTQPYFLLRSAGRFARLRPWLLQVAAGWLFLSCAALVLASLGVIQQAPLLLLFVYYVAVDGSAVYLFLRFSASTRGVVRRRMLAIGLGTAAIVLAVVAGQVLSPAFATHAASILALIAALSYVCGFTPPGWLVRRWQLPEIDAFVCRFPERGDVRAVLTHLATTSLTLTGAMAIGVADLSEDGKSAELIWHARPGTVPPAPMRCAVPALGAVAAAAQGTPGVSRDLGDLPPTARTFAAESGVQEFTALPIGTKAPPVGFLIVLPERSFLFAQDDIALLGHLARHAAIACEHARLLAATQREARRLAAVNNVMQALVRPLDPQVLAAELLAALAAAASADVAELFVLEPDALHLNRIARHPAGADTLRWPVEDGIQGLALQRGEAILVQDVQGDDRFVRQEEALREGYRSVVTVPLLASGTRVGVFTLIHKQRREYPPDELAVLYSLAAPIAAALQNTLLHATAERRLRQFQSIHQSAVALTSDLSMDDLLTAIAHAARGLTGARYAALNTVDALGRIDHFVTSGLSEAQRRSAGEVPQGHGLLRTMLERLEPLRLADISAHPDAKGFPDGHPQLRSFLGVPIVYSGKVLGTLYLADKENGGEFPAEDERTLQALAAHAAVAITSARLLSDAQDARIAAERANDDLEQASRAKSDFLASMSHELRTPLNAILGFTELMLDDDALEPDRRRHYLETVHSSGRHLLALINDILDLSKVEAGQMDLAIEAFDAGQAVHEVVAAVHPLAAKGGIALDVDCPSPTQLQADRGKFKQILYNLLSNAIKFTEDGGHVAVECRSDPDEFSLTVADTGIGIAPEDQERIFDAFQQLEASSERRYKGTGLGLALVRRFVDLHGGRIALESAPNEGSRFRVFLPVRGSPSAQAQAAAAAALAPSDGPLVLVVEDDTQAGTLLQHIFESSGFRVALARDGEEALRKVKALRPAAVTLDVLLPGIDGWGVLQVLKGDPETRDVPIVVVTVLDNPTRAYALGASDYFVKPVDRQTLLARIAAYARVPGSRAGELTVLAVDDDPQALALVDEILRREGLRVLQAQGGEEALTLAERERPDIMLLDLMMPGMSGFEVLATLRSQASTASIPVLILTARDLTPDDKRQLSGQALAVLRKGDVGKADLVSWILGALGSS